MFTLLTKNSIILTLSAGLFDLKLACDPLSDIVFYAFTSSSLKRLIPRESAIFYRWATKTGCAAIGE